MVSFRDRAFVKSGVVKIDVLLVHFLLAQTQAFTKALEVDDLTLTQKSDYVVDIGVVTQTKNVVVGLAGFLLCCDGVRKTF